MTWQNKTKQPVQSVQATQACIDITLESTGPQQPWMLDLTGQPKTPPYSIIQPSPKPWTENIKHITHLSGLSASPPSRSSGDSSAAFSWACSARCSACSLARELKYSSAHARICVTCARVCGGGDCGDSCRR